MTIFLHEDLFLGDLFFFQLFLQEGFVGNLIFWDNPFFILSSLLKDLSIVNIWLYLKEKPKSWIRCIIEHVGLISA